jgi:hypothetical protein
MIFTSLFTERLGKYASEKGKGKTFPFAYVCSFISRFSSAFPINQNRRDWMRNGDSGRGEGRALENVISAAATETERATPRKLLSVQLLLTFFFPFSTFSPGF